MEKDALIKLLEIKWNDFFQSRSKIWHTYQIEVALAAGMIVLKVKEHIVLVLFYALLVVLVAILGIAVLFKHFRKTDRFKKHILFIEKNLGIPPLPDIHVSVENKSEAKWKDSIFISHLLIHLSIIAFVIVFVLVNLC